MTEPESKGTRKGWSYWEAGLGCQRRAWYADQVPKRPWLSGIDAIDIGTLGHLYLELYYGGAGYQLDTAAVVLPAKIPFHLVRRAAAAFRAYRLNHSPEEFGKVIAVEEPYTLTDFLGVLPEFTIRPDMEVELGPEEAARFGVEPGYYVVDHKFFATKGVHDYAYSQTELRFPAYLEAVRQLGRNPKGLIVNAIYGSSGEVSRFFVPPPSQDTLLILQSTCRSMVEARTGAQKVNTTFCWEMGRSVPCPFLNKCNRRD